MGFSAFVETETIRFGFFRTRFQFDKFADEPVFVMTETATLTTFSGMGGPPVNPFGPKSCEGGVKGVEYKFYSVSVAYIGPINELCSTQTIKLHCASQAHCPMFALPSVPIRASGDDPWFPAAMFIIL